MPMVVHTHLAEHRTETGAELFDHTNLAEPIAETGTELSDPRLNSSVWGKQVSFYETSLRT